MRQGKLRRLSAEVLREPRRLRFGRIDRSVGRSPCARWSDRPKHPGRKLEARYALYLCHPRLVNGYASSRRSAGSIRSWSLTTTRNERRSRSKDRITLANPSDSGAALPRRINDRSSGRVAHPLGRPGMSSSGTARAIANRSARPWPDGQSRPAGGRCGPSRRRDPARGG